MDAAKARGSGARSSGEVALRVPLMAAFSALNAALCYAGVGKEDEGVQAVPHSSVLASNDNHRRQSPHGAGGTAKPGHNPRHSPRGAGAAAENSFFAYFTGGGGGAVHRDGLDEHVAAAMPGRRSGMMGA